MTRALSASLTRIAMGSALACTLAFAGCGDNTITWQEEVKLLDGRVIAVTQKNRIEEGIPREFWLAFELPEISPKEITWHENLMPIVLNIYQDKLYVVGIPFTKREFRQYGEPKPPYLGYRYEGGHWQLLAFNQIPEAIYDSNLYFDNMALARKKYVSLHDKAEMTGDERYRPYTKRIDPKHVSG
jgi:hypothetical protein